MYPLMGDLFGTAVAGISDETRVTEGDVGELARELEGDQSGNRIVEGDQP